MDGLPRGGICSYCKKGIDEVCVSDEGILTCGSNYENHFERVDVYSNKPYNGTPEPILDHRYNQTEYRYFDIDESGKNILLKEFGDYKCQRCAHISHIPQNGKLVEPFECENDVCGRKGPFKRMFPVEIMNPAWKTPTGIIETESAQIIFDLVVDFIKDSIYFEDDLQYSIFALWIMASWVPESFDTCPYLMFIAPKDSGKTRGLDIITEIGYRAIPAVSFSSSSMFRSVEMWHCTLMVDEAEYQLTSKTEKGMDLYAILNGGYKRGMYAVRTEQVGDKLVPMKFDVFGFKAIAATRTFNPTLESRSIIFHMQQHAIRNKIIPKELTEELRNRLLYFRFTHLKKIVPVMPTHLDKGRIIEIFHPIYTIAKIVDESLIKRLDAYIETTYKKNIAEDKVSMPEADIIRAIVNKFYDVNNPTDEIFLKDIVDFIKYDFPDATSQQVGYLLKGMGFIRQKKDGKGMMVDLKEPTNRDKFKMYIERFGVK